MTEHGDYFKQIEDETKGDSWMRELAGTPLPDEIDKAEEAARMAIAEIADEEKRRKVSQAREVNIVRSFLARMVEQQKLSKDMRLADVLPLLEEQLKGMLDEISNEPKE